MTSDVFRTSIVVAIVWASAMALPVRDAGGADWPHWRGPTRDGLTPESSGYEPGKPWPGEPAWRAGFGVGSASPVVIGDRVYLLGWHDDEDHLTCADLATGKPVWQQSYPAPRHARHATGDEGLYEGPTATPEYDPETKLLYTLGLDGHLACWDTAAEGRPLWAINLYDGFKAPQRPKVGRMGRRDYGYVAAPLVHGDLLLVEAGAERGTVVALDKRSGAFRWGSRYNRPAGHSGGLAPMTVAGVPCVAAFALYDLVVVRLDAGHVGETVGTYEWTTDFGQNIATPGVVGDQVLITAGYNHQATHKVAVSLDGGIRKVWEAPQHSLICSPVIRNGRVFFAWQEARCLDLETGKQHWSGGRFGDAGSCVLTADDKLIVWGGTGKLALAEASADSYKVLAEQDGLGQSDAWPHVVLANGRLLCKDRAGNAVCFRVSDE
jgi:outer membrane protein assembly factor BamB